MVYGDARRQSPVRRDRGGSGVGGPVSGMVRRPQLVEELRTLSSQTNGSESGAPVSALCDEKPIATGNGLSISISLAEPVLYLQGFDQNDSTSGTTTMLRGSLHLHVTKQAKLKSISLNFRGKSETEWPEGIPPRRTEFRDAETIMNHTWPFFNAQFPNAEHSHCADIVHLSKGPTISTKELGVTASSFDLFQRTASPRPNVTSREAKRLSLQLNQSRSLGRGESINGGPTVAQKGFKVFHPGDYVYNFELPVDSRLPESINVELGNVKYELEALVERSGAFRANLVGTKELTMIRAPAEGSLEQIEPIAISRNWEDQLHYDIVISGKSFPLGASVPIAFKLTPLAKVQCHRIKVFITENIQYFTANKRVHRLEPTRKVQLFEKRADGPSISAYPGSSVRVTAGGGIAWDHREAAARGEEDVPRDPINLLGNLDYDSASIGPTEMEFTVKLPSCHEMNDRIKSERIHFDTTYQNIQVNHWIKIVMRLSRPDENDSTKRRHFEISIDSPFHILSCRATAANTSLPAYTTGRVPATPADEFDCGCPGAAVKRRNTATANIPATNSSTTSVDSLQAAPMRSWTNNSGGLTAPSLAHVHDPSSGVQDPNSGAPRPIHLLRNPSFNPPPFSEEEPPPPLMTPPPNYDNVVSGDSRSALADYFARLADEMGDDDEQGNAGRVDIPLTPGARINRSMDASRTWLPLGAPAAT
jgi:arrestin-related trafficking adapter 3/6